MNQLLLIFILFCLPFIAGANKVVLVDDSTAAVSYSSMSYSAQMTTDTFSPAQSTTYYFAGGPQQASESVAGAVTVPVSGTINKVTACWSKSANAGSDSTSTLALRKNQGSPSTITSSINWQAATPVCVVLTSFGFSVAAGDELSVSLVTGAHGTAPTLATITVIVYVE